jgi:hypothetical protein
LEKHRRKNVELARARNFRRSLVQQVEQYQNLLNENQFEKLQELLPPDSRLLLLPLQKKIEGNVGIIRFWKAEKRSGLKAMKFKIRKIFIEPCEKLVKEGDGYKRFDALAFVFGTYSYLKGKSAKRVGPQQGYLCLAFRHRDDCNWGLGDQFLG